MAIAPHPSSAVASAPAVGVVQGEGRDPGLVVFEEALVGRGHINKRKVVEPVCSSA